MNRQVTGMRFICKPYLLGIMLIVFYGTITQCTWADEWITLASGEHVPYIGNGLPEKGYVAELVIAAFAKQGYRVKIEFYPWARARQLASEGKVDGILPIFNDSESENREQLIYSKPFPGDTIGLLKKKSFPFSYSSKSLKDKTAFVSQFEKYSISMVRGSISLPVFKEFPFAKKQIISKDIQSLDMLEMDRIQFALIDKYTAADLLTSERPHLIGHFEFLMPALAERDFFIGFSSRGKQSKKLQTAFNEGLDKITKEGKLETILKKHGLFAASKKWKGKTLLTIGTVDNNDMKTMQSLSKEFERQHPHIALEWRVLEENTLRLRLLGDLAISDGQFDIMTIGTYEAPIWAKQKWLAPLELANNYDINDILPTVRNGISYAGKLFGLPFYAESSMMYYRKDLFSAAKVSMPVSPTYDDILQLASKIHKPSEGIYGICLRGKPGWGENMAFLSTLVNSFGGRWFDEKWNPEFQSEAWEKAIEYYVNILTKYGPPHPETNGFNENLQLFREGHCGIWIDATVAAGMLFDPKRSKVAAQLGYVAAPKQVTQKGSAWLWSWGLAIPNSSLHKKAATEFISWATSKKYIQTVAKRDGWVGVPPGTRKSTYKNPKYLKAAPFAKFVLTALENANEKDSTLKPKPYLGIQYVGIPEFPAIGHQVGIEISKALQGKQSVKQALTSSQIIVLEQMKSSGYVK